MAMYAGFIPFRSEADWWANFADILNLCPRCGNDCDETGADDSGHCPDCVREIASAEVVVIEDWSEERQRVEAWLDRRGL